MSEHRAPNDGALRAMLEERADRAGPVAVDVRGIVASAGRRARRPRLGSTVGLRLGLAGGGAAVAVIALALVAGPLIGRPGSSPAATTVGSAVGTAVAVAPPASPSPDPTTGTPLAPLQLLTAREAGEVIRTESSTSGGMLIAVQGRLETAGTATCAETATVCGATILADAGGTIAVRPVGDIGPGPWDGSGPIDGEFVLRLDARPESGVPVTDFVGRLTMTPTGGAAWFVQDILEGAISEEGSYAAVQGWLVRDGFHPCPSDPRNPPVSYGCPTDDWLTEDEFQPLRPDGSMLGPSAAISLSSGSYDRWAPDPAAGGPGARGVQPREGTYLMWLVSDGCGPNADCAPPPPRWRIVGRFDAIEHATGTARSPDPIVATDGRVPAPDGNAWSVAQLLDRPPGVGTYLVRGWLVATPQLRCLEKLPRLSGEPEYGCGEVDWLTDEAFQPWVSNGSGGGTRDPAKGIRVQNGAYAAFAPSPAGVDGGGLAPRFGTWIVRETTRGSPCPYGNACAIPTTWWEVVGAPAGLLDPVTPGRLPDVSLPPGATPQPDGDTPCVPTPGPCG